MFGKARRSSTWRRWAATAKQAPLRVAGADIVERGVAFEYEESAVGITCVAAPVLDIHDEVVAGISVTGPVGRFQPTRHASAAHAAAAGIAATMARRATLRAG